MATMQQQEKGSNEARGEDGQRSVGSPISNDAYNVITALQAKLEGLEAYRKYASDDGAEIWARLTQPEMDGVEILVTELERLVREGRLRVKQPGSARS